MFAVSAVFRAPASTAVPLVSGDREATPRDAVSATTPAGDELSTSRAGCPGLIDHYGDLRSLAAP